MQLFWTVHGSFTISYTWFIFSCWKSVLAPNFAVWKLFNNDSECNSAYYPTIVLCDVVSIFNLQQHF